MDDFRGKQSLGDCPCHRTGAFIFGVSPCFSAADIPSARCPYICGTRGRNTADLENGQKRAADYKFSVDIRGDGRGVSGGKEEGPSMSRRVDEILDKINERGFSSLTEEERDFLRRARDASK